MLNVPLHYHRHNHHYHYHYRQHHRYHPPSSFHLPCACSSHTRPQSFTHSLTNDDDDDAHYYRLFDATAKHSSAEYPYPILPVHWMSRMKGADGYSDAYFVP
jgi:hypothetical protein